MISVACIHLTCGVLVKVYILVTEFVSRWSRCLVLVIFKCWGWDVEDSASTQTRLSPKLLIVFICECNLGGSAINSA
jgi:hypothetical protein